LGASVWGRDPATLDAVARRLEAGTIWINQHLNPHPDVPFTGHKASGLGVEFGTEGFATSATYKSSPRASDDFIS
jgi:acyl-CoA reductase-like NAD-dependent aldehyde dehydrogenase